MFFWKRTKLINIVGPLLREEIELVEKKLGKKFPESFGIDPYVLGYLAVTAAILAVIRRGKGTTIVDKVVMTPKCIQMALGPISPSHRMIHKIINDQDNIQFREGTKAAAEVMEHLYQSFDKEDKERLIPEGFLSKNYKDDPEIYPSDRYFIDYVLENYAK